MRKNAQKSAAKGKVDTFAVAFGAVLWGFVESAVASASRSADAMRIVANMYETLKGAEYTAEVAKLFGNGQRGKENVKGDLIDALELRCKAEGKLVPVSARGFVSQVRTVAINFGNEAVRKAAAESGTRAAYDVAKPKAAAEVNPKGEPAEGKKLTFAEVVAAEAEAHGLAHVVAVIESYCATKADPIRGAMFHDLRVKLAK
jgi:hypothetical protein